MIVSGAGESCQIEGSTVMRMKLLEVADDFRPQGPLVNADRDAGLVHGTMHRGSATWCCMHFHDRCHLDFFPSQLHTEMRLS